jgi:hypothetical protein
MNEVKKIKISKAVQYKQRYLEKNTDSFMLGERFYLYTRSRAQSHRYFLQKYLTISGQTLECVFQYGENAY